MRMDRRHLLQLAGSVAGTLWLPRSAWSQPRFESDPFALGVASGSPTHDSVVLWTRLVQPDAAALGKADITVRWEMAHDAQFKQGLRTGQATASAQLAHSVHVEVPDLEPDRWYHYRFMVGQAVSATGRTRTFPAPGTAAKKLRLAYASCQHWEHGHYSAYRHMLEEQLDAVLFLGDYIYEYAGTSKAVRPVAAGTAITLDEYRARYALYKGDVHLQRMHAACPWLMTWDDHEVQNDYAGTTPGSRGPDVADFAARRAAAYQAYYEHMPLRAHVLGRALAGLAQGAELRLYGRIAYGDLATLYLLDDRQYRDPQACTKGGVYGAGTVNPASCGIWSDPRRTLLGAAQEQWLDSALGQDRARWSVLGQQTLFGQRDFKSGPAQHLSNDGWDGYAPARTRLTNSLQRHAVANPVFLGGDIHANWVGQVKADYARPDSAAVGVEFCGTSITSRGGSNEHLPELLVENPHFVFADRERRGYGVVEFTPQQLTTTLRTVTDVTRPDAGIETLAQFTVVQGRTVLEKH
nr:alkaline phosphatase D family protein [Rhodoferax saidenbachensis]